MRAHQHAAGAPKKGATLQDAQAREALGRSRGGLTTKLHVRAEGGGKPVAFVVSPGQRHECRYAEALLDQGAVKRPGRGRPRLRPERVAGDKGYTYPTSVGRSASAASAPSSQGSAHPCQVSQQRRADTLQRNADLRCTRNVEFISDTAVQRE